MTTTPLIMKETANGNTGVRIVDELFNSREIFLTDPVDFESMDSLIQQLLYLERDDPEKEITLYINCPGGEVSSGLAAYDFMKLMTAPVRTVCMGTAASMGAILFLAGKKREMLPNSRIMIHDPSHAGGSLAGLKPTDIEERLDGLKKIQTKIIDIISEETKQSKKIVAAKTKKDTYFSADEAVKFGIATDIVASI